MHRKGNIQEAKHWTESRSRLEKNNGRIKGLLDSEYQWLEHWTFDIMVMGFSFVEPWF